MIWDFGNCGKEKNNLHRNNGGNMKRNLKKKAICMIMVISMFTGSIAGCSGKNTKTAQPDVTTMSETESSSQTEEESLSGLAVPETEQTTTDAAQEETTKVDFTAEKEKLLKKLEQSDVNLKAMKASTERDVYDFFLNTLQAYYEACGDYTTEESTIGDLITGNVADSLSGGSSTISSSIQAAAKSIKKNGVTGELVTDAFAAAMEELPNEIVSNVMEYLLGGTVMKALNILKAAIPQNEQSQHLVNMIDTDIKRDIVALSQICQKQDLTAEDCYMGEILVDSIIYKSSAIERITGINAGSFAWSAVRGNSWVALDLSSAAYAIETLSVHEKIIDILNNLEEIPDIPDGEYEEYLAAMEQIKLETRDDRDSKLSLLESFGTLGKEVTGAYDADDAKERSKGTNLMNSVNMVIGNPISDIFVYNINEGEKVFADAVADYNAEVIPLWKERYVPLMVQTQEIIKTMNTFQQMFSSSSFWTDITPEMRVLLTKEFFGGLPSMEVFEDTLANMGAEFVKLSAQTSIMKSAYHLALLDSQTNTSFIQNYEWADRVIRKLCNCTEKSIHTYTTGFQSDEATQKTAEASKKLISVYAKNMDKREDIYSEEKSYMTAAYGKITHSFLYKRASNGTSIPTILRVRETVGEEEKSRFYYVLETNQSCYWVSDQISAYSGFPGYFPAGGGYYFHEYPEKMTEEIWRPVLLKEHGENVGFTLLSSGLNQGEAERLAEDLRYCLTADVEEAKKANETSIKDERERALLMEKYEKKITELQQNVEAGKDLWLLDPEKVATSLMIYYVGIENPKLLKTEFVPKDEYTLERMVITFEGDETTEGLPYSVSLVHPDFISSSNPIWVVSSYTKGKWITNFLIDKYMESLIEP